MLRNHSATTKDDPLVNEVELIHANPTYAYIKHPDGREATASLKDLSRCPRPKKLDSTTSSPAAEMVEPETEPGEKEEGQPGEEEESEKMKEGG